MNYPIASFEDDKNINIKMGSRSVVAQAMVLTNAVAAWYEDGHYWFMIQNQWRVYTAIELVAYAGDPSSQHLLLAIDSLAQSFKALNYPPGPPIIDPIYFGT